MRHRVLLALARLTALERLQPALEVVHIDVPVAELPVDLDGFLIAHVSDLHVGDGSWMPMRSPETTAALRAANPHIAVNTGDYVQDEPPVGRAVAAAQFLLIEPPTGLAGPANLAVLGNHDYYAGDQAVAELKAGLAGVGVDVLVNRNVPIRFGGRTVWFTGLTEAELGFDAALDQLTGLERPRIVLVHEADIAERLPAGAADLILAGHTHGGQITLPGLTPLIVRRFNGSKYIEGLYRVNENLLYVNRGLGCTGLPVRFRARPELTLIRLVR